MITQGVGSLDRSSEEKEYVFSFSDKDLQGVDTPHDDAIIISAIIANLDVKRILMDSESLSDILFYNAFSHMRLFVDRLKKINIPLYGFSGNSVKVEGKIILLTMQGQPPKQTTASLKYLIARVYSTYNAILGRSGLKTCKAVASTYHLLVHFPTKYGIKEVWGDQQLAQQCFMASAQKQSLSQALPIDGLDLQDEETWGEPVE